MLLSPVFPSFVGRSSSFITFYYYKLTSPPLCMPPHSLECSRRGTVIGRSIFYYVFIQLSGMRSRKF